MTKDDKSCADTQSCAVPIKKGGTGLQKDTNPVLSLQHEVNRLFGSFFGETVPSLWHSSERLFNISPATDVAETDKQVKVSVELPGMDAKDVTVDISEGYITIKGKKSEEKKEEKNGYFHQERSYGEFQRVISLPANISSEKAEASIKKGVLTVTVPKKEGAKTQTRKVEVKQAA